jgi:DNA invertase Pin-like site-specific DNA recombinase
MKIGYARVSTNKQSNEAQIEELKAFGCERIFTDIKSAVKDRPGLAELLDYARSGDALVVTKLDRLARSTVQAITMADELRERGIELVSIRNNIDTTTAQGRAFYSVIATFAELEREIIRERTSAGLATARARGRTGGRPRKLTAGQVQRAIELSGKHSISSIAKDYGVHPSTLSREIARSNASRGAV